MNASTIIFHRAVCLTALASAIFASLAHADLKRLEGPCPVTALSTERLEGSLGISDVNSVLSVVRSLPTLPVANLARSPITMIPVPDAAGGGCLVETIDNVEVLKGPASVIWGADANAGVVNITRSRVVAFEESPLCRRALDAELIPNIALVPNQAPVEQIQSLLDEIYAAAGQPRPFSVLAYTTPDATPESFIASPTSSWDDTTDGTGPTYWLSADSEARTSFIEDAARSGNTIYFEFVDECVRWVIAVTTETMVASSSSSQPPPDVEDPRDVPEEWLVTRPPEDPTPTSDDDDDDETPCCGLVKETGDVALDTGADTFAIGAASPRVAYPVTTEFLSRERANVSPPAMIDTAIGGVRVALASGSMYYPDTPDLAVPRLGVDVVFRRVYAGDMQTTDGGVMGHRWDFSYDKRIVPVPTAPAKDGLYIERVDAPVGVYYANGWGRSDLYSFASYDYRVVRNFGFARHGRSDFTWPTFSAHVTTFKSPPGAFDEIQRYVLDVPSDHPFSDHPNVHIEHGESIFYVLRTKHHMQYVFSCRGQLIYIFDRHRNYLEFHYDETRINPITHNPLLVEIVDTQSKRFSLKYVELGVGSYLTNLNCEIKDGTDVPIYRLSELVDPWQRVVRFNYNKTTFELESVAQLFGTDERTRFYEYQSNSGRNHLLTSVTLPEQFPSGAALFENTYQGGRVVEQRVAGGSFRFNYVLPEQVRTTDPAGHVRNYVLERKGDQWVISRLDHFDASSPDADPLTTMFKHNDDTQITRITFPRGNSTEYVFEGANGAVTIEGSPIRNDLAPASRIVSSATPLAVAADATGGTSYHNNLARGNLLKVIRHGEIREVPGETPTPIEVSYAYEPFYNATRASTSERGYTTSYSYVYNRPGAEGNAVETHKPDFRNDLGLWERNLVYKHSFSRTGLRTMDQDPEGNRYQFQYHETGRISRITPPAGPEHIMERDDRANLVFDRPPSGAAIRYQYNLRDEPTMSSVDPDGFQVTTKYLWDRNGNPTVQVAETKDLFEESDKSPKPKVTQKTTLHEYDDFGRRTTTTQLGGSTARKFQFTYDANGNRASLTEPAPDGSSRTSRFEYDRANRLIRIAVGEEVASRTYDDNGNLGAMADANGRRSYEYDGFDRVVRTNDERGATTDYEFDAAGHVTLERTVGPDGHGAEASVLRLVEYEYDEHDRPLQVSHDRLTADPAAASRFGYDRTGRRVRESNTGAGMREIQYDAIGRPLIVTDPMGNQQHYTYDERGNVSRIVERDLEAFVTNAGSVSRRPNEYVSEFQYDAFGNVTRRSALGEETKLFWSSDAQLRGSIDPAGRASRIEYDGFGRVTSREVDGMTTSFVFAGTGAVDPNGVTTPWITETRRYDAMGRVLEINTPDVQTIFEHDASGQVISERRTSPRDDWPTETVSTTYAPGGLVATLTSDTTRESFTYDGLGRLTSAGRTTAGVPATNVARWYDGLDNVVREDQTFGADTQTIRMNPKPGLDGLDVTFPRGAFDNAIDIERDWLGRVSRVKARLGEVEYHYAGADRTALKIFGAGQLRTSLNYDDKRRLSRIETRRENGTLDWLGLARTTSAGMLEVSESLNPNQTLLAQHRRTSRFEYDRRLRPSKVTMEVASRGGLSTQWFNSLEQRFPEFDQSNRTVRTTSVTASALTESAGEVPDYDDAARFRIDEMSYQGNQVASVATKLVRDGNRLPSEPRTLARIDATAFLDSAKCGDTASCQTQTFRHGPHGQVLEDWQNTYRYDHAGHLLEVHDKVAEQWGYQDRMSLAYDAFGRMVYRGFSSRDPELAAAFDRRNVRFLYYGDQVIAEVPPDSLDLPYAIYVPGAQPGESAIMARRPGNDPDASMQRFYLHYSISGEVSAVSKVEGGALEDIATASIFTGQSGRWQAVRPERYAFGTTFQVPVTAPGMRHDAFLRTAYSEAAGRFIYDYRAAPFIQLDEYRIANWDDMRKRMAENHPPFADDLRIAGYVWAAGVGLVAAPAYIPAMLIGGTASAALGAGINAARGIHTSGVDVAQSFTMGVLSAGIGAGTGTAIQQLGLGTKAAFAAGFAVDVGTGTMGDVAVFGQDFTSALIGNAIGGLLSTAVSAATSRALKPVTRRLSRSDVVAAALQRIRWLAAEDGGNMLVAREFLSDLRGRKLRFGNQPVRRVYNRKTGGFETRSEDELLIDYIMKSDRLQKTIIALDSRMSPSTLGLANPIPGQNRGVVRVNAAATRSLESPDLLAVTLLHEFVHIRGGVELQAWDIQLQAMFRLGMHASEYWLKHEPDLMMRAMRHSINVSMATSRAETAAVLNELGEYIRSVPAYKSQFANNPLIQLGMTLQQAAEHETVLNPHSWVSGLTWDPF